MTAANSKPSLRRAVVVGAFGGIGAATVSRLAAEGWDVVAMDLPQAAPSHSDASLVLGIDLADPTSISQAFEALTLNVAQHGPIDLLAVCSGIVDNQKVAAVTLVHWQNMLATNLTGPFLCCQHSYPLLRDGGRIVLLGSLSGRTGGVLTGAAYAATKGGIESLAKSMAPRGITVNVIAPGAIETPMLRAHTAERKQGMAAATPLKRLGQPEEIAGAVVYLASADAGFITGTVMHINGGIRMD
jgi:3-oxoacyl-[acyl-carrier protein] reductase